MSQPIDVLEAQTHLLQLILRVESGEEITLTRIGTAVARIVPIDRIEVVRRPGLLKGRAVVHEDFDEFTAEDEHDWYGDA